MDTPYSLNKMLLCSKQFFRIQHLGIPLTYFLKFLPTFTPFWSHDLLSPVILQAQCTALLPLLSPAHNIQLLSIGLILSLTSSRPLFEYHLFLESFPDPSLQASTPLIPSSCFTCMRRTVLDLCLSVGWFPVHLNKQ